MPRVIALIPAAGGGTRFGGDKLLADLYGQPVLRRAAAAFAHHLAIDAIVVIAGAGATGPIRDALGGLPKVEAIVPGGASRQESVGIGLFALGGDADDMVLVHDGARPLVTPVVIDRCLAGAREKGNAVAAIPVADTLKAADDAQTVTRTVERDGLWAVQTPQCFRLQSLFDAHVSARDAGIVGTDEASLVERLEAVHLVLGSPENVKITRPEDLRLAEAILRSRESMRQTPLSQTRVGFGYDIHRFADGRRLVLGGVEIPAPQGLDGHSDADVLLHAVCDALLGAAGLPDIGQLYPNTDPALSGISSLRLLADVFARLQSAGLGIINVDATVIAEAPKIGPFVPLMRDAISRVLHLDPPRIGIKATTNEGLGALGAGLGIAAHAVASLTEKE